MPRVLFLSLPRARHKLNKCGWHTAGAVVALIRPGTRFLSCFQPRCFFSRSLSLFLSSRRAEKWSPTRDDDDSTRGKRKEAERNWIRKNINLECLSQRPTVYSNGCITFSLLLLLLLPFGWALRAVCWHKRANPSVSGRDNPPRSYINLGQILSIHQKVHTYILREAAKNPLPFRLPSTRLLNKRCPVLLTAV